MRIAHLSDLHFGRHDPAVVDSLAADLDSQAPDLVVVSGDFTQMGTRAEFTQARAFLDTLAAPVLAVPGNHDVPQINMIRRILDPYGLFRRFIAPELEPFIVHGKLAIAGLNTARQFRWGLNWAHGSISRGQLATLERRFAAAPPDAVRVVVAHHPLLFPEEAMEKKMRLVKRADLALQTFARLGVRMVMSGHFHMTYVRRHTQSREIREDTFDGPRQAATAPLLVLQTSSTLSTRLRGHPNAYNLVDFENERVTICVREWTPEGRWVTRDTALEPV